MENYLRVYKDENELKTVPYGVRPRVSHIINTVDVVLKGQYLTFTALEDVTFSAETGYGTLKYSLDSGETWSNFSNNESPVIHTGEKIMWKGYCDPSSVGYTNKPSVKFSSSGRFDAEGNPMSVVYDDEFDGMKSFKRTDYSTFHHYVFQGMFAGTKIVNAEKMVLPAETLPAYCYTSMFANCTELISAPELPAKNIAQKCYFSMFYGCSSLKKAPSILPSTGGYERCYYNMFSGCTSLEVAPEISLLSTPTECCVNMFKGCSSLKKAPELLPENVTWYAYSGMFATCTS